MRTLAIKIDAHHQLRSPPVATPFLKSALVLNGFQRIFIHAPICCTIFTCKKGGPHGHQFHP